MKIPWHMLHFHDRKADCQDAFHTLFLIAWLVDEDSLMCCIFTMGRQQTNCLSPQYIVWWHFIPLLFWRWLLRLTASSRVNTFLPIFITICDAQIQPSSCNHSLHSFRFQATWKNAFVTKMTRTWCSQSELIQSFCYLDKRFTRWPGGCSIHFFCEDLCFSWK